MSRTGLFLPCQNCDEVAADTESSAGADADASCGTEALELLTIDSGIDDACVCFWRETTVTVSDLYFEASFTSDLRSTFHACEENRGCCSGSYRSASVCTRARCGYSSPGPAAISTTAVLL